YWSDFGYSEERSGEPINDAVFARNTRVEERYGIDIVLEETADVRTAAQKSITAGDDLYDVVMPSIDESFAMAQAGHITDLSEIPWLDPDRPWWDGVLTESLSLCGRIYVASGDISMEDEEFNWCIIFNKPMIADYNLDNPYDAVRSGSWTFEYMRRMGRVVTADLNGDGVIDHTDSYGYGDDYSGGESWHSSAGEKIAELDPDGVPRLVIGSERSAQVMDRVTEIYNDHSFIIWVSGMKGVQNGWGELNNMLIDGRLLFRSANIYNIKQFRAMTDDFGLLPAPKYDAEQAQYSMMVFTHACAGICVPVTNGDTERTGILLEALASESAPVADAYYNVTLTGKFARDEESLAMLEIIFDSRTYDIGKVFGWGKLTEVINNTVKAGSGFASKYEAAAEAAESAMRASYEAFSKGIGQG
ncbi:MAG: extracellular solute-binding protein, partial [Eubacteriales bacterium]|nr:extracellular solute-binding protein [Eubacteriales bacterium]